MGVLALWTWVMGCDGRGRVLLFWVLPVVSSSMMVFATLLSFQADPLCFDPAYTGRHSCLTESELQLCRQCSPWLCSEIRHLLRLGKLTLWSLMAILDARLLFRKQARDCTLPLYLPLTQLMHQAFRLMFATTEVILGSVFSRGCPWINAGLCMFGATSSFLSTQSIMHVSLGVVSAFAMALIARRQSELDCMRSGSLRAGAFWAVLSATPSFYLLYDVKHSCAGSRLSNAGNEFLPVYALLATLAEMSRTKRDARRSTDQGASVSACSCGWVARPRVSTFERWVDYHQAGLLLCAAIYFVLQLLLLDPADCWTSPLKRAASASSWMRLWTRVLVPYVVNLFGVGLLFVLAEYRDSSGILTRETCLQPFAGHEEAECEGESRRALVPTVVSTTLKYLEVTVVGAKNLHHAATCSGLYCTCSIPGKSLVNFNTQETKSPTVEPKWGDKIEVVNYVRGDRLHFAVWSLTPFKQLGRAQLESTADFDGELPLLDPMNFYAPTMARLHVKVHEYQRQESRLLSRAVLTHGRALHSRVPASHWCVTRDDLVDFHMKVRQAWVAGRIPNDRDPSKRNPFHDDPAIGPSIYAVVEHFIRPETRQADVSWALMTNPEGLKCEIFVTHAWIEGVFEFIEKVLRGWPKGANNLWCCFLANPQNGDVSQILGPDVMMSPFALALNTAKYMIVVPNNRKSIYTRLWCVYEAMLAMEKESIDITLPAALPPERTWVVVVDAFVWGMAALAYSAVLRVWHQYSKQDLPLFMRHGKKTIFNANYFGFNLTYVCTWVPCAVLFAVVLWDTGSCDRLWRSFMREDEETWRCRCWVFGRRCTATGGTAAELHMHRSTLGIKKRGRLMMAAVGSVAGVFVGDNLSHREWSVKEKTAKWSFAFSILAMGCKHVVWRVRRSLVAAEAEQLHFNTVMDAECFDKSDRERIRKAIKGKEKKIDSMINTIISAGKYNAEVRTALALGMHGRQHKFDVVMMISSSLMCLYISINSHRQAFDTLAETIWLPYVPFFYPAAVVTIFAAGPGTLATWQTRAQMANVWVWWTAVTFGVVSSVVWRVLQETDLRDGTRFWKAVLIGFWISLTAGAVLIAAARIYFGCKWARHPSRQSRQSRLVVELTSRPAQRERT